MDADPSAITVATTSEGRVAVLDMDGDIVFGPIDPRDDAQWQTLDDWLRGYLLDN